MPTSDDSADRSSYPWTPVDANLPAEGDHPAIRLSVVDAGPRDGKLAVLLHGFPEYWYSWRHQIAALTAAGYRVLAPDMRGYGGSDKPEGVEPYRSTHLVADVARLIAWAGQKRAFVVGHDWGAVVAWMVANDRPEVVEKLAILNVPHPKVMMRGLRRDPGQMWRSWYVFFFQIPGLPEVITRRDRLSFIRLALAKEPQRPGAFTKEDVDRYVEQYRIPGVARAAISYYRAALRYAGETRKRLRPIALPVQVIWGEKDVHLGAWMADPPPDLVPDCRVLRIPDASHWVQNDAPERVNEVLLDFFGGRGSMGRALRE